MDLRDLRYFETIARLEHIGKASKQLHRTQPALTGSVRRLEQTCGAPLFERAGRGIRLTEAGRVLYKWAQRLRFDVEDARREIADIGRGLSGHVRVGIVPTAAQFVLPPVARRLLAEAPEVTLKTVVALIDVMKPLLRAGELDLMVGTEATADADLVSRPLMEDQIVVAASAKHPIFRGQPRLRDLVDCRWVLQPPGAPTRDWLDQAFEKRGLPRPRVHVESTMLLVLPALIAETGLLSFISRRHLEPIRAGAALKEVRLKETTMRRRLVVAYRDGTYLSPATRKLVTLFGEVSADRFKAA